MSRRIPQDSGALRSQLWQRRGLCCRKAQITELSALNLKDPTLDDDVLVLPPGILDGIGPSDINNLATQPVREMSLLRRGRRTNLSPDILFNEPVQGLVLGNGAQDPVPCKLGHRSEPSAQSCLASILISWPPCSCKASLSTTAASVTDDSNGSNLEGPYTELEDGLGRVVR